jgi:hypothetical protein
MASQQEKNWVQTMLAKAQKPDEKAKPSAKNDVDMNEVENLTKSIQRRIQRGE